MSQQRRTKASALPREARREHLYHLIQTAPCPCMRHWAAGELGKLWAEEALDEIRRRLQ